MSQSYNSRELEREDRRRTRRLAWIVLPVLAIAIFAATIVHAIIVYDDWRCAFAECRIVKTTKP